MVTTVSHVGVASESDGEIEAPDNGEIDAPDMELKEILNEVNPQIHQSCFGGWFPKNSRDKSLLSKKFIKSFGAVTKIKLIEKNNSEKMEKFISEMVREKPVRFSGKQLKSFTWNFSCQIGSGGYGKVYKGKIPPGLQVAVKVLNGTSYEVAEESFMAELRILGRTYHRNIVRLFGFCFDDNIKALVFEYMEIDLDTVLFDNNHTLVWEKLYDIAVETAKGISYLHDGCEERVIHYDIKPSNILLDSKFCPKLADFGLSKLYDRDRTDVTSLVVRGTIGYIAPEVMILYRETSKSDVYSFGSMLFEIVGRQRNWASYGRFEWFPLQLWNKYEKGELEELLTEHGIEEKDREKAKRMSTVALWCVQHVAEDRPSMSSVVKFLEGEIEVTRPPNPFYDPSYCFGFKYADSSVSVVSVDGGCTNAGDGYRKNINNCRRRYD